MVELETASKKGLSSKEAQEIYEREKVCIDTNPLGLLTNGLLSIKTKKGDMVRLSLNTSQRKLFNRIKLLREQKKRVRIWLLKYRQGGISTEIEGLIYALTSQQPNRNSLIMADEKDKSDNLFQMSKLFQEKLEEEEPHLATPLRKSNEKKLEFENLHSQIIIETAENSESARSFTYQYVHLSECAFFKDLKAVMDALNQSVPDHWDTMIIGETTANGMNLFYKEWLRAIKGETDWIPLFFAWFEMAEYSMPLENEQLYPINGILFDADTTERLFIEEETALKQAFRLSDEQINWRRWAIVNKCQGDILRFKTEYPSTWEEAFSLSGDMFFDRNGLNKQFEKRPKAKGEIFYESLGYEFRDLPEGRIKIYEYPVRDEQYIVSGDASEAVGSDEAAIVVLNKRLNTVVATVAGSDQRHAPEELAHLIVMLGNYYNKALAVCENKGYGYQVNQLVYSQYGNVYRKIVNKDGVDTVTDELGFNTNTVTRPQILAQLNDEIKHHSTELISKELIDECKTFVIKKDKKGNVTKIEAQDGCQDGLVMARAIAGIVRQQYPYVISKNAPSVAKQAQLKRELDKPIGGFRRG